MVTITEKNPVWSHISKPIVANKYLRYEYTKWTQGRHRMEHEETYRSLITRNGLFMTGFLPRLERYLKLKGVPYKINRPDYNLKWYGAPHLEDPEIDDFYKWQKKAFEIMMSAKRGVWKAPTGSGKTVLFGGLASATLFPCLFMVHTETLFHQTIEEFNKWFGEDEVGYVGRGQKKGGRLLIGMIQSIARIKDFDYKKWGMVVVDEAHHVNKFNNQWGKALGKIHAPFRYGLTATLPMTNEGEMALEGLIGPLLGETTYYELKDEGLLAVPKVRLIKTPGTRRWKEQKGGYAIIYDKAIVGYRARNKLIVDNAVEQLDAGRTVLIMVERIEHGEKLLRMLDIVKPGIFAFLHSDLSDNIKTRERRAFQAKARKGIIATRVWSEGVNIKSVGCVINAVGGDSEIAAIQRFGRGMRVDKDKEDVVLIDFFDSHHNWFIKHSGHRVCTYISWGWL